VYVDGVVAMDGMLLRVVYHLFTVTLHCYLNFRMCQSATAPGVRLRRRRRCNGW
jgi:hypothetical protein